ncbi:hypothetical protein SynMITS9220_01320 [Synechococcus sp. MIT S9220]|nr:hypothetical protein SynMITS9220_01320 [Synechococcus sp. MIT S9220]
MPLAAPALAGQAAMMESCFERVRIDSADQPIFLTKETKRARSRKSQSEIICLSPCQYRTARGVLESLLDLCGGESS